jgi:hypothetical protein
MVLLKLIGALGCPFALPLLRFHFKIQIIIIKNARSITSNPQMVFNRSKRKVDPLLVSSNDRAGPQQFIGEVCLHLWGANDELVLIQHLSQLAHPIVVNFSFFTCLIGGMLRL